MVTDSSKSSPILLVARPATGGLRAHIVALASGLDPSKWSVSLAGPKAFLDSLPGTLEPTRYVPLDVAARPSPADFASARRLAAAVRSIQAQSGDRPVVHAHGIRAAWVSSLARAGAPFPLVVTLHNVPPANVAASFALGFIAHYADKIICVSAAIAAHVPGERKRVIPNGIDLSRFQPADREAARHQFDLGERDFVVAAAARLSREKGIDLLVEAARTCPEMVFLIAGAGHEEAKLKSVAPANVWFLGRIEDTPALFAASDAVAIPSRSEGQGIVAIEAMAAGASIVATNIGGLAEMITDGVNGLVVPPNDPSAIANALKRLKDDSTLRSRLAQGGREYAARKGNVQEMIAGIEDVYLEAAGASG